MRAAARARVWVDAFSAFNVVEMRLLAALAGQAASVDVTVLGDPAAAAFLQPGSPLDETALFHRTARMYHRVHAALTRVGIAIAPMQALQEQHRLPVGALAVIERQLFGADAAGAARRAEAGRGEAGEGGTGAGWNCGSAPTRWWR